MPHAVVVGGGITGLVAAFRLSQQPGLDITLLEARKGVGGKINTVHLDGVPVELGPDSFLPRDDRPLRLCADIGLSSELVEPQDFGGWLFRRDRLTRLPSGTVLGFPASLPALARASVLTPRGRLRAAAEVLNKRPLSGPDVSVGSFTRSRLGAEVLERLVDPLLAGTRAGDVDEMSLAAAIPPVDAAARAHRSVILGLRKGRSVQATRPRFFAPRGGMHRLVEALEDSMPDVELRRNAAVDSVQENGAGFALDTSTGAVQADAVIVTAPSYAAARMLRRFAPIAAEELAAINFSKSAVVNLVFPPGGVGVPEGGSGVLVPSSEAMTISGCTWFSNKWPNLAADDGRITIRCFVGRGGEDPALQLGDRDLIGIVVEELRSMMSVSAEPSSSKVTRWDAGLPRYTVGHLERVARIEQELSVTPRFRVAGASLRGSGIPDCIAQAERSAAAVVEALRG